MKKLPQIGYNITSLLENLVNESERGFLKRGGGCDITVVMPCSLLKVWQASDIYGSATC